ncbi:nucleotide disphospho-sugar-binding domain-containing protein [Streptomyces cyaneofuscatus]|uniref:nucleotide disphospho-sugar-binding domain-containing protein n=1 Tax=Streptomyces cyaneofuscatus TaxID=66883 RepID=UPI00365E8855
MRVLFAVIPLSSHVRTNIPLAQALRSAGHDVRFAGHPNAEGLITGAGMHAVLLGDVLDKSQELLDDSAESDGIALDPDAPDAWEHVHEALLRDLVADYFGPRPPGGRSIVDELVDHCRTYRPDLVIWDPLFLPAAVAARACGAAHGRLLWASDNIGLLRAKAVERALRDGGSAGDDPWVRALLPAWRRHGLEFGEDLITGQWSISTVPERMRPAVAHTYLPMRYVPFDGGAAVPGWLHGAPERPRLCVTWGGTARSVTERESAVGLPTLFEAVADLDCEVVATVHPDQLAQAGPVPGNVRTVEYVPLSMLLPTCTAVVHQGGDSTFATAVAHGLPQVVNLAPKWGELYVARYLEDRGAGVVLRERDSSAAEVRGHLERVLTDPSYRRAAGVLREEMMATPTPHDLVAVLENVVMRHRR